MNGNLEVADELIHPDFEDHEPAHPEHPTGPESVKLLQMNEGPEAG